MTDLITLTGPLVDHQGATPLAGVTVTATPSRDITRTSDGEDALTGATAMTDETGTFELELVHAAGLRYLIQYRVQGKVLRPYTLDCDSWPAGSTVTIQQLPPIAGVPPSAVEDLQAWVLAHVAGLDVDPAVIEQAVIDYLTANPVGVPAHNDTTGRDALDAHPMTSITGLVSALAGKQAAGSYATTGDLSGHASDTTAVHGIADTSALVLTGDARLSDARTPTAHKASHATGGGDALTPADIGAATSGHTHAAPDLSGYVPTSRTVNGKALSANITLTAADVGASTFSGAYADLTNKPTLGTAAATASTDYATAAQGDLADSASQPGHTHVATTDLTATGTKDATTFLRGDNTWAVPAGGGGSGGVETALYLPGASGNYVSTPSTSALRPAAALDVRVLLKANNTTTGTVIALGEGVSSDVSWSFYFTSSTLRVRSSTSGGSITTDSCSVSGSLTGAWQWVRFTYEFGSPNDTVKFYISSDGSTWIQQGTTRTHATIGSFYATPNPLLLGAAPLIGSGTYLEGQIQRAEVRDGVGGTVVASWDGRAPATRYRGPQGNIWTLNGTANAWGII